MNKLAKSGLRLQYYERHMYECVGKKTVLLLRIEDGKPKVRRITQSEYLRTLIGKLN